MYAYRAASPAFDSRVVRVAGSRMVEVAGRLASSCFHSFCCRSRRLCVLLAGPRQQSVAVLAGHGCSVCSEFSAADLRSAFYCDEEFTMTWSNQGAAAPMKGVNRVVGLE